MLRNMVRSPPSSSQVKSQFLRLCGRPHSRKNFLFTGPLAAGSRLAVTIGRVSPG